jgi:hypothetical protein
MAGTKGFDPAPVLARFPGASNGEVADLLGVTIRTVNRWRSGHTGIICKLADEIATQHLGLHPALLWPEWLDEPEAVA